MRLSLLGKPVSVPMKLSKNGAGLWQYSSVVPANSALKLYVVSSTLKLADSAGKLIESQYPKASILIHSGNPAASLSVQLTVKGTL